MKALLIIYDGPIADPGANARLAGAVGSALGIEMRVRKPWEPTSFNRLSRGRLAATADPQWRAITSYSERANFKMSSLRRAAKRIYPAGSRPIAIMAACPMRTSSRGTRPPSQVAASFGVRELLSAVLANSHACQNWLAAPTPNLDKARLSISNVTRDLNLVIERVYKIRVNSS